MSSNFERLQKIINQAYAEDFSCLFYVEPRNLLRSPYLEGNHFLVSIAENISILLEIRQDMNKITVGRRYFLYILWPNFLPTEQTWTWTNSYWKIDNMYQKIPYQMNWSEFSSKSLLNDQVLKASLHQGNLKSLHQTREDGTIESAVPLPARVVRGHPPSPPGQYIDALSP